MNAERRSSERIRVTYRLEVDGRIDREWGAWFEADTITPAGPKTILEVHVADQAELYGRLRHIHDLNLRLISLRRIGPATVPNPEN